MSQGLALLFAVAVAASPARAADAPAVTVVVRGGNKAGAAVSEAIAASGDLPLSMVLRPLPNRPAAEEADFSALETQLAAARGHYIDANFSGCARALEGDGQITALLDARRRELAARLLFWRTACLVGAGSKARAAEESEKLAIFALRTPADVEAATPEVEEVMARAKRAVQERAKVILEVTAPGIATARVLVDGRDRLCLAPCEIPVAPGEHLVAIEADGFVAQPRQVRASGKRTQVAMEARAAGPELTAAQWTHRYASARSIDSAASLSLLARATRSRRLLLIDASAGGSATRYRGALLVDGEVVARAERRGRSLGDAELAEGLIRDIFSQLELQAEDTPLYKRTGFWVGLGVAAAAAAGLTALLARDSDRRTGVTF